MFEWNPDKIRFLEEASVYRPFNRVLAEHAASVFSASDHILDAGCGIGFLSIELAGICRQVTAADRSEEALDVLRRKKTQRDIQNIRILNTDVFTLSEDEQFDGAVFCFFGTVPEILSMIRNHVRRYTVLFKKNWTRHRFSASRAPMERFSFSEACRELEMAGVPYWSETFGLEMGQPFHTLEDARKFFAVHDRDGTGKDISDQDLTDRLISTGEEIYPYYLSSQESVGMIVLETGRIPETITPFQKEETK